MQIKPVIVEPEKTTNTNTNNELNEDEFFEMEMEESDDESELERQFIKLANNEYTPLVTKTKEFIEMEQDMAAQVSQKVESIVKDIAMEVGEKMVEAIDQVEEKIEEAMVQNTPEVHTQDDEPTGPVKIDVVDAFENGVPVQISVEILPTSERLKCYSTTNGISIPYTSSAYSDSYYVGNGPMRPSVSSSFSNMYYTSSIGGKSSYMESMRDERQYSISLPSSPAITHISNKSNPYVQSSRKNDPYCFAY